jgi:hypothetical protein
MTSAMITSRVDQLIDDARRAIFIHDGVLALKAENERLREALQFIISQEPLTFAECSAAEAIMARAKAALEQG